MIREAVENICHLQTRTRHVAEAAMNGGTECQGPARETQPCYVSIANIIIIIIMVIMIMMIKIIMMDMPRAGQGDSALLREYRHHHHHDWHDDHDDQNFHDGYGQWPARRLNPAT